MSVQTEVSLNPIAIRTTQKWRQLVIGLLCMASISSPQYVWTLLTKPFIERLDARRLIGIGTLLTGTSWVVAAYLLYGCIGGIGTGIVYIGIVGQVVGWFPEQRGFAAGMVAAGYGMGAIVTTLPISVLLNHYGLPPTSRATYFCLKRKSKTIHFIDLKQ